MSESTTASEAVEATLREHLDGPCSICENHDQPGHLAADVIHTIRSLSPEQLAELIGGRVQWSVREVDGSHIERMSSRDAAELAAKAYPDLLRIGRSAVTPWLPVIPFTHQGEETT